ncbi:right-handed parallel beta-helix repeat-containing protein [Kribbella sp. NPDC050459]|uniref:right-handed parallel beta-helix repeat-containing protein n=1 Tax=Kribbella sp. NPDC050459 TaxID=3155785 RepID=UPI0033E54C04
MTDLRALSTPSADTVYFLTDPGLEGPFRYLAQDTSSAENYGTVIVGANAARYHRILLDNEIDTGWFGTIGDGANHPLSERFTTLTEARAIYPHATALTDEIDWCAIQAAINTAKSANAVTTAIRIPRGDYVINQALRAEVDGLLLRGLGGASISIEMDYFGLMVNRGTGGTEADPQPVYGVQVRDLTFRAMKGYGPTNGGIIIFNNCRDLLLDNVTVVGDAAKLTERQRLTNGIGTSQGTTGVLRNCLVDGTSKPGYYIANGSHHIRIEGCEARNVSGSLGYQPGFGVSGADSITLVDCQGHDNQGAGLQITCDGYPAGVGTPSTNIQVIGGQYSHNRGNGILMGTNLVPQYPRDVQLVGVDTSDNELNGFLSGAGTRVVLADHVAHGNKNSGIAIVNYFAITSSFQVIDPQVANNAIHGVEIRSVDRVTIQGGRTFDDQAVATQGAGVALVPIAGEAAPSNIRILDVDAFGNRLGAVSSTGADAISGQYRLTGTGSPENVVAAPVGSQFTDLAAGLHYVKTVGTGKIGWKALATVL